MSELQNPAKPPPSSSSPPVGRLARPILVSAIFFMMVTGLGYPLLTTASAQLLFSRQARGSLIQHDGQVVGSELIGQSFTRPEYFHGRPSVTSGADPADSTKSVDQPYNASVSAASNQGVLSKFLLDAVASRAKQYREENGLAADAPVPVDAVTASASGLDPDISLANTHLQALRVAKARGVSLEQVESVARQHAVGPQLGVLGDPRVNVLQLNIALDGAFPRRPSAQ